LSKREIGRKEEKEVKDKSIFSKANGAGKGDEPRMGISQKKWEERWEKIFGKNKKEKK
jgi:hypothetical protein